ncbi:hypothetical protein V3H18_12720, partial [Methylocystis sp. 9N]
MVDASLLRAVVDQFVGRTMHPPGDVKQLEQLALGFIDILDSETVARVALPLCFHPETPQTIFARLFDKGGAAAALAFQFAPFVAPRDMIATAEHGPIAFAAAIARRRVLDRETVAALASRSEPEILRALAGNLSAHLDAGSRRALVLAARDDATLARMLLDRDDLDIDPEPLFLAATRLERKAIVLTACRRALTSGTAETPRRADAAFVARLEEAALRRDRDAMAGLLADALDCRKDRARALVADSHGEALALALSVIGVSIEQATHILQGVAPAKAQNPEAAGALAALMRSTPQRAAARLVGAIVGAARAE